MSAPVASGEPEPVPVSEVLSVRAVAAYAVGGFGQGLLPLVLGSWVMYFYCPPDRALILAPATLGLVRLVERIVGALIEPVVGHLSDGTKTRFGRRRPWMLIGLPFLVVSFVAIWFPPQMGRPDAPEAIVWVAVCLMTFYAAYTAVFAPYNALLPELSRESSQRIRLSVWMGLFEVGSNIFGSLAASPLIGLGAVVIAGVAFTNGYEVLGVVCGVLAVVSMIPVLLFTKESVATPPAQFPFLLAVRASLQNQEFLRYGILILGFRMASMAAIIGVPYLATQLMGLQEEEAPLMLAVIIVVATFAFPVVQRLANRYGKARVFRWGAFGFVLVLPLMGTIGLGPLPPLWHGAILFFLAGFSVATLFVLPRALLADVIDHDERLTGFRREAMYTGMSGVLEKIGEALATGAVGVLFQLYGSSAAQPLGLRLLGLVGAAAVLVGLFGFRRYHLDL